MPNQPRVYTKKRNKNNSVRLEAGDRRAHTILQKVFKKGWAAGQLDTFCE
jgi:hypothetical protein